MRIEGVAGFQAATGDVALLVDGENLSPAHAPALLDLARALGSLRVARVYGRFTHLGDWGVAPGFNVVVTGARPQAADMQIAIDAVAMAHGACLPNFVIVSDDRDFTALAFHLREAGCSVLGVGTAKAPSSLRAAFSRFEIVGVVAPSVIAPEAASRQSASDRSDLDLAIRACFEEGGTKFPEVTLTDLATKLRLRGYSRTARGWRRELVEDLPHICEVLGEHPHISVRLVRQQN